MKKNKVIGVVLLGIAFILMVGSIITNPYLTFFVNSIAIMGTIVCGIVLIFIGKESK